MDTLNAAVSAGDFVTPCPGLDLPAVSTWQRSGVAGLWISRFHFSGRPGFALPFSPERYVWSPTILVPVAHIPARQGAYRRGVAKYRRMFRGGSPVPPVLSIFSESSGWVVQDGNHRIEAAMAEGCATLSMRFGWPLFLRPAGPGNPSPVLSLGT